MFVIQMKNALWGFSAPAAWQAIGHYMQAYKYNPKFISALSTIAYCYQQKKDYKQAVGWYEKYLKVAKPGSKGYDFAADNLAYVKSELFMEEAR